VEEVVERLPERKKVAKEEKPAEKLLTQESEESIKNKAKSKNQRKGR